MFRIRDEARAAMRGCHNVVYRGYEFWEDAVRLYVAAERAGMLREV